MTNFFTHIMGKLALLSQSIDDTKQSWYSERLVREQE